MMGQVISLEIRLPDLIMNAASHEAVVPVSTICDSEPWLVSGLLDLSNQTNSQLILKAQYSGEGVFLCKLTNHNYCPQT